LKIIYLEKIDKIILTNSFEISNMLNLKDIIYTQPSSIITIKEFKKLLVENTVSNTSFNEIKKEFLETNSQRLFSVLLKEILFQKVSDKIC
jgi:hypothetical protein